MIQVSELRKGIERSAGLTSEQVWWGKRIRVVLQPPRSGSPPDISFGQASVAPDCEKLQLHPERTFQSLTAFNHY